MDVLENMAYIIKKFWECNIKQDYSEFDFMDSFVYFECILKERLGKYGLLGYDEFISKKDIGDITNKLFTIRELVSDIGLDGGELLDAVMEYKYKITSKAFSETKEYIKLLKLYNKLLLAKEDKLTTSAMVFLFDEIIHSQHESGMVFKDLNIDKLHHEFENNQNIYKPSFS